MLILVFEVIVQPPKTHFLTFSSETKIMKITYCAKGGSSGRLLQTFTNGTTLQLISVIYEAGPNFIVGFLKFREIGVLF